MGACQSNSPLQTSPTCRTEDESKQHQTNGCGVEDLSELPISEMLSYLTAKDLASVQDLHNKRLYKLAEDELMKRDNEIKRSHPNHSCASTCRDRVLRWETAQDFGKDDAVVSSSNRRAAKSKRFWQEGCRDNTNVVEDISGPIQTNPTVEIFVRIRLKNTTTAEAKTPLFQGFVPIHPDPTIDKRTMEFYTYIAQTIYGLQLDMKTRKTLQPMRSDAVKNQLQGMFAATKRPGQNYTFEDIEIDIMKITQRNNNRWSSSRNKNNNIYCKYDLLASTSAIQLKTGSGGYVFCYFLNHRNAHRDEKGIDMVTPLCFLAGKLPRNILELTDSPVTPSDQAPVMF